MRNSRSDARPTGAVRAPTPDEQVALRKYIDLFGEDVALGCFEDFLAQDPEQGGPVEKPGARLSRFLCACVGARRCL